MRRNLDKKKSTKPERILYEILKELHIPFRHRWIVNGREIDFLIGNYAIEIDGHEQNGNRNHLLAEQGFIPIHISNDELYNNRESVKKLITKFNFNGY